MNTNMSCTQQQMLLHVKMPKFISALIHDNVKANTTRAIYNDSIRVQGKPTKKAHAISCSCPILEVYY